MQKSDVTTRPPEHGFSDPSIPYFEDIVEEFLKDALSHHRVRENHPRQTRGLDREHLDVFIWLGAPDYLRGRGL